MIDAVTNPVTEVCFAPDSVQSHHDIVTKLCTLDDGKVIQPTLADINTVLEARGQHPIKIWQAFLAYLVACYTSNIESLIPREDILAVFGGDKTFDDAMAVCLAGPDGDMMSDPGFVRHLQEKFFEYLGRDKKVPCVVNQVDGFATGLYVLFTTLLMRSKNDA